MFQDRDTLSVSTKGWLLKWTNFVKGYRRRWFVLTNGHLSYYREKSEDANELRGTIFLLNALIHKYDTCAFVISRSDSKEVFYLKAANPTERHKWIVALTAAKAWAIDEVEKDSISTSWLSNYNSYQKGIFLNLSTLGNCFETIQKSNDIIASSRDNMKELLEKCKNANNQTEISKNQFLVIEWIKLFKVNSRNLVSAYNAYLDLAQNHYTMSQFLFDAEVQNRHGLLLLITRFDALYSLLQKINKRGDIQSLLTTIEKHSLRELQRNYTSVGFAENASSISRRLDSKIIQSTQGQDVSQLDDDDDYRSTSIDNAPSIQMFMPEEITNRRSSKTSIAYSYSSHASRMVTSGGKKRRKRIPDRPNQPLNLWGFMKNCIGKDLSKIPMPVQFSEPLSFLQRVAEDFAYSNVLDLAADCQDPLEELAYLAAFTVSCYSTTANRHTKPFNPLLGETFEWDRSDDLGWRLITEQVSHHPPISAQYCEGRDWTCWQEFSLSSKFRGKHIMVVPLGISHIVFHNSNNHYTWNKVTTLINNIIIGKLWVDNTGEMSIVNHTNASKCHIQYFPYSIFKPEDQRRVFGEVTNSSNQVKWIIKGRWDAEITIAPVLGKSGKSTNPEYKTGPAKTAWLIEPDPEDNYKYYHFNEFACQLNEMEEGIAPTDSRNRPDQRLMEEGRWDEANNTKTALEQKQRNARKKLVEDHLKQSETNRGSADSSMHVPVYEPRWFKTELDITTGRITYAYNGGYWESKENQDWFNCPNIYL